MKIREIIIVAAAALLLLIFFYLSGALSKRQDPPKKEIPKAIKPVEIFLAENRSIQTKVPLYGRLIAYEKIELFAEVSGMLVEMGKSFRPGMRFQKGEVLFKIDDKEAKFNLQAQRAALLSSLTQILPDIKIEYPESLTQWEEYRANYSLEQELKPLPTPKSAKEKDYISLKNIYNQYYNIKSLEERLSKYTLYAPFACEITEAMINTGSYIRAGQKLATLMNTAVYEMEASVPLKDLSSVKLGDRVSLKSEDISGTWIGSIARISSSIDNKTQTVKVYIQVSGSNLRENLYLSGEIEANIQAQVIEVSRTLLVENEKIFTVPDSSLQLLPVQVVKIGANTVLLRGVPDGTRLLKENFPGAFEGMPVRILQTEAKVEDQKK
jgi:multidrug efflux pump subunit AcrA (membrane-fusion protein)